MTTDPNRCPVVLTIAGFDPSGAAGIVADIKAILAFRCTPLAAMTSLTFQNSARVSGAIHQTAASLRTQTLPLVEEFKIDAVKIGMLPTRDLVLEVVRLWRETKMPAPVVDPILRASSGYELMEPAAKEAWLTELMPLARLITPNVPEAEVLSGKTILDESDMRAVAGKLRSLGAVAVLIKGGHLEQRRGSSPTVRDGSDQAIDVLDDEGRVTVFRDEWIEAPPVRGTGCMLSSGIAAGLAQGLELKESVRAAKQFVADMIRSAVREK